jgi:hypothetical protein
MSGSVEKRRRHCELTHAGSNTVISLTTIR